MRSRLNLIEINVNTWLGRNRDIPVNKIPYYTGSISNMGNSAIYAPGTYTLWAESNVNQMNDNYNVTGKTISKQITLLNQGVNPLITKATTMPTQTTAIPTLATPRATTQTIVSTTVPTPSPTESLTTMATNVPSPSQTKAPGFEACLAIAAILFGLVVYLKKE